MLNVVGPLTDPTATRRRTLRDAFDVVVPSMPGYGFSERPSDNRLGALSTSRKAWIALMRRLG